MNQDVYSLKDIVFGLRPEYLKIKNKLKDLESYIQFLEKFYEKCMLVLRKKQDPILICYFFEANTKYIRSMIEIEKELGISVFQLTNFGLDSVKDDTYFIENEEDIVVKITKIKEFNEKIMQLLNSNFANLVEDGKTKISNQQQNYFELKIKLDSIYQEFILGSHNLPGLVYYPVVDILHFSSFKPIDQELVDKAFQITYSRSMFNEYQQSLIEGNRSSKPITLIEPKTPSFDFTIFEDDDQFMLRKK